MSNKPTGVPDGYHTATPYLIIKDAASAIDFYKKVFGATEFERMADDSGKIRHAEIKIGDSMFMITDEGAPEYPDWQGPLSRGGSPVHIYLYVEDCDDVFNRAVAAGAKELLPVKDQFYGDRSGGITDPYGHIWYVATRKETLTQEELLRRAKEAKR
jgi:PhnB protein